MSDDDIRTCTVTDTTIGAMPPSLDVEVGREDDGRFIAAVVGHPGVMAYGTTEEEAIQNALDLLQRVLADGEERRV